MTRETKVGLLIGTLILLLVGIVVSDHLAVKQEQERLASDQFAGITPESVPNDQANIVPGDDNTPGSSNNNINTITDDSAALDRIIPTYRDLTVDQNLRSLVPDANQHLQNTVGNNNSNNAGNTTGNPSLNTTNRNGGGGVTDVTMENLRNLLRNGGVNPQPPTTLQPVIHYVKDGETLWSIAQQYYDDGSKWNLIAKHNKDRLLAGNHVREGLRLEIPNRQAERAIINGGSNNASGNNASGNSNRTPAGRTITVKSGDNLTRLAEKHLGSSRHINLLLKANRDKIRNANQIRVGMVLRLPVIPSENSTGNNTAPDNTVITTNAAPNRSSTTTTTSNTYIVQEGDTLSAIAAAKLGNRNRWREIWKLNKSRIPNHDRLSEGVALVLPPRER